MKGAEAIVETLLNNDVRVCFGNPGTSEMHLVAALDSYPLLRPVLCLFEGVATGAADGYARMTGHPAATLLHLGPGLANGLANLHNARRAGSPVLNIVGDHAESHRLLDSPLASDIDAAAQTVSARVIHPSDVTQLGPSIAEAIACRGVATVIVPADLSWSDGAAPAGRRPRTSEREHDRDPAAVKALLSGESAALLLDGQALTDDGLNAADRIAQATGARLFCPTWPARLRRGAGVPAVTPLAYRAENVSDQLGDTRHLLLVGARPPVASFAYPGRDGRLTPPGITIHDLGASVSNLIALADEIAPAFAARPAERRQLDPVSGPLTADNWTRVVGALLPENAIVCDEAITSGLASMPGAFAGAPAHDVLGLVGLAIGQGLPLAAGAAIACPDRPVICLEADGSAMYTLSALWTHARENLNVTTIILNNRSYKILRAELDRVGAVNAGAASMSMMDLTRPDLDFVALSAGMGVPATRARTGEELAAQFAAALATPGPHLIDAVLEGP
ncbi:acetolactate synthase large subunit [Micromonospora chokoriensis]